MAGVDDAAADEEGAEGGFGEQAAATSSGSSVPVVTPYILPIS